MTDDRERELPVRPVRLPIDLVREMLENEEEMERFLLSSVAAAAKRRHPMPDLTAEEIDAYARGDATDIEERRIHRAMSQSAEVQARVADAEARVRRGKVLAFAIPIERGVLLSDPGLRLAARDEPDEKGTEAIQTREFAIDDLRGFLVFDGEANTVVATLVTARSEPAANETLVLQAAQGGAVEATTDEHGQASFGALDTVRATLGEGELSVSLHRPAPPSE